MPLSDFRAAVMCDDTESLIAAAELFCDHTATVRESLLPSPDSSAVTEGELQPCTS